MVQVVKPFVTFFKLSDGFLELDVMHEEVAFQMVEIRMDFLMGFKKISQICQGIIVLLLYFEEPCHQKMSILNIFDICVVCQILL